MNYSAPEQMGIGRHVGAWWACPVLDTGASFLNSWIPAGVYPDKNRGRTDDSRQAVEI